MKQSFILGGITLAFVIGYASFQFSRTDIFDNYVEDTIADIDIGNTFDDDTSRDKTVAMVTAEDVPIKKQDIVVAKPVANTETSIKDTPVVTTQPTPAPVPEPTQNTALTPSGLTMAVVGSHNNKSSCYTVVNGSVYDVTSYIPIHPGGQADVLAICGRDGSGLFQGQHGGQRKPEQMLAQFRVGALVK